MFIPPNRLKEELGRPSAGKSELRLKSAHLLIGHQLVQQALGAADNVYMVYYPDRGSLLIAPVSDELFKNLHKASQHMLKSRNLNGDKSIAIHEILIDHQLDRTDRDLEYELEKGLGILKVNL
ncbi:MAG: hypothetical protein AAGG75_01410 [Bacteroidota bacterium]